MDEQPFVPETLSWCKKHYVPKVNKYITCEDFGHSDGMNGSCHWCLEMTPYQWEMCQDEDKLRFLMKPCFGEKAKSKSEAITIIENEKF